MYLNQILKSAGKKYPKIKFKGICFDTRKIKKHDIFFAIKGNKTSGKKYIKKAIAKGAASIITDEKINKSNLSVPLIYVKNSRLCLSEACSNFYKKSPKNIIAVTGTNGKTSVASFFNQILNLNKIPSASIGTLGIDSNKLKKKTLLTSMDPIFLHKHLSLLEKYKINHVIIEASSHGLDQNRLDNIKFITGIFTNLSHDHLDYHHNMNSYLNSKMYLFKKILPRNSHVITDINNIEYKKLKKISLSKKLKLKTIGSENSHIKILDHYYLEKGQLVKISYNSKIYEFKIPLIGYLQFKNLLMSILAAILVGVKIDNIVNIIKKLKAVDGRLEHIGSQKNNSKIILDYAHTPHALEQALKTIKKHFNRKILIVFGCGGERDVKKRSLMGKIAKKYCRKIFVTDDNPRMENPAKIRKAIIGNNKKLFMEIPSRKKAIETAVKELEQNEILIVAGKGHEKFQDFGKYQIKFSDKDIIKKSIKKNKKLFKNYNWKFNILKNSIKIKNLKKFSFKELSIDSQKIKKNSLFVAIKGKNKDGHDYVKNALKKGAVKAIVSRKLKFINQNKQIKVSNTHNILKSIGYNTRNFSNSKVIGITGTAGKTTLKNLLNFVLLKYGKTHSSPKSFNNQYGVPISVSNLSKDTEFGIFEIGMSKKGEINELSKIVRPNIGVITNISYAHKENFHSLKDIAKAKAEILNNISEDGYIILNKDDKFFKYLYNKAKLKKLKILSFSLKKKTNIYLKKIIKTNNLYKLIINIQNKDYLFYTKYNFKNFIQNVLATLSILSSMNLDLNIIKKSIVKFYIPQGRGDISKISIYGKSIKLIDESYNANPLSMKSAINNFSRYKKEGSKKILILGDMLELGNDSKKFHRLLSNEINKTDISKVYVYGNDIKETYKNLKIQKKGGIIERLDYMKRIFKKDINNNDVVMIKGSNATGLFKISQNLKKGRINAI